MRKKGKKKIGSKKGERMKKKEKKEERKRKGQKCWNLKTTDLHKQVPILGSDRHEMKY